MKLYASEDEAYQIRTGSAPVTNKVDDRKMCVVHSDDAKLKKFSNIL